MAEGGGGRKPGDDGEAAGIAPTVAAPAKSAGLDGTQRSLLAMTVCPACHVSTPVARYCTDCGAAMAPRRFCTSCGAALKAGAPFCSTCGVKNV
jgi:hypothetical protein